MSYKILNRSNNPLTLNNRFENNDAIYMFKQIFNVDLNKTKISNISCDYYDSRLSFHFKYKESTNISLTVSKDLKLNHSKKFSNTKFIFTIKLLNKESHYKDEIIKLVECLKSRIRYIDFNNELKINIKNDFNETIMEMFTDVKCFKGSLEYYQKIMTIKYFTSIYFGKEFSEESFYCFMKYTPEENFIYIDELENLVKYATELPIKEFEELLILNYKR